jgi:hypothetical protein
MNGRKAKCSRKSRARNTGLSSTTTSGTPLELKSLPATKDATEAQARDTMALFTAETEKRRPKLLIVDTTEFLHRWAET